MNQIATKQEQGNSRCSQEQERDYHRAESELSGFLHKVDIGTATHEDVVNARHTLAFFGINAE